MQKAECRMQNEEYPRFARRNEVFSPVRKDICALPRAKLFNNSAFCIQIPATVPPFPTLYV